MVGSPGTPAPRSSRAFALALLSGAAVALTIGVHAKVHRPALRPLFLVGFSGMLQLKTWLATAALLFVVVQVRTALWMWGRLPGPDVRRCGCPPCTAGAAAWPS